MKGKPLHTWEYKGKRPEGDRDAGWNWYKCKTCGFALVSYNDIPPALNIQRLISHNSRLRTCEKENV